jgi:hypothetical protein
MKAARTLFDRCMECERGVYMVDTEDDPIPGSWCAYCGAREPIYIDPHTGRPVEQQYGHLDLSNRRTEKRVPRESVTSTDGGLSSPKSLTPSYKTQHRRVVRARGSASLQTCRCGCAAMDWANLTGDRENILDYEAMCRKCHYAYDGAQHQAEPGGRPQKSIEAKRRAKRDYQREYMRQKRATRP